MKVGKWYPLAERLSRWARIQLLKVALDGRKQVDISRVCGVAPQAVFNWLAKNAYHPNDKNASVLLGLAWEVDRKRMKDILRAGAERYSSDLRQAGIVF